MLRVTPNCPSRGGRVPPVRAAAPLPGGTLFIQLRPFYLLRDHLTLNPKYPISIHKTNRQPFLLSEDTTRNNSSEYIETLKNTRASRCSFECAKHTFIRYGNITVAY